MTLGDARNKVVAFEGAAKHHIARSQVKGVRRCRVGSAGVVPQ